ncbi:MAG: sulfite exporter TauE/SafE family protein [Ginsengibacter sp.]
MPHLEILLFFFIIAFIYASVGFGGGSSYLAILALYALHFKEMRLIALICNIIVVTGGTIIFIRHQQVNWKKILPLALVSVPMAFLGATIKLNQDTFFVILGCSLIVAAVLLWIKTRRSAEENIIATGKFSYIRDGLIGGAIGFLSGMVGIGGGIFLSPLLNLIKWDTAKKIAATASIFILVNSVAGIAGQLTTLQPDFNYMRIVLLCGAVFLGGQLGSRMGAIKFNPIMIRRLTAILVFAAGVEVLFKHLKIS